MRKGCTVLVATPGRLLDHVKNTEALKLDSIKCFVLDEADRMLDMGYEKDISGYVAILTAYVFILITINGRKLEKMIII